MQISIISKKESDFNCDALILPFVEDDYGYYDNLIPSLSKQIHKAFQKEFSGKHNQTTLINCPEDIKYDRVLLAGLGKKEDITSEKIRQSSAKAACFLRDIGMKEIAISSGLISSLGFSISSFLEGSLLSLYKYNRYKKDDNSKNINSITILSEYSKKLEEEIKKTKIIVDTVYFARDLINTPANDLTPSKLANISKSLENKLTSVTVLEKPDLEKLGMGSYLSVSKGSDEPPKFIIVEYKGKEIPPVVIIGKSITFDSGGISLKPSEGMEKMKYDMAGGAAVLGVIKAVSELELPVHVIGILPATENLIGSSATRPGDIIRAYNGKTIEIISTDAEGRMTLADAICYAKNYNPSVIIDIATLTGACSIAFGNIAIAMMGNSPEFMEKLKISGLNVYERVWEMPLFEEAKEYLKSDIADLKNSGGKSGSLCSSAYFLYEFANNTPWIHLDIAGTAWNDKDKPYIPKGASGIGVRLLFDFICNLK